MRVFTELTKECDLTAQMYAVGLEKKEIAAKKFRAVSTISNQLQKAFEILHVRNGRELAIKFAERVYGIKVTLDFGSMRTGIACVLLVLLILDSHLEMQRQRTRVGRSNVRIENVTTLRVRRGRDVKF